MEPPYSSPGSFWRSSAGIGLALVVVFGGFLLYTEHRAHVWGALPYLLILACPLMHLFMHRGHRHGGRRPDDNCQERRE